MLETNIHTKEDPKTGYMLYMKHISNQLVKSLDREEVYLQGQL